MGFLASGTRRGGTGPRSLCPAVDVSFVLSWILLYRKFFYGKGRYYGSESTCLSLFRRVRCHEGFRSIRQCSDKCFEGQYYFDEGSMRGYWRSRFGVLFLRLTGGHNSHHQSPPLAPNSKRLAFSSNTAVRLAPVKRLTITKQIEFQRLFYPAV
jgi:hypothetical protein